MCVYYIHAVLTDNAANIGHTQDSEGVLFQLVHDNTRHHATDCSPYSPTREHDYQYINPHSQMFSKVQ